MATKAPVVQSMLAQKEPIDNIRVILDNDPTNDLQEQMFVYIYIIAQQKAADLCDDATLSYTEHARQKAQANAPEGVNYAKTNLDEVTVSAS